MQDIKTFVEDCFKFFIEDAKAEINNKTEKVIENISTKKNDEAKLGSMSELLENALDIFIKYKGDFEAKLINAIEHGSLSSDSGYNTIFEEALKCLRDKEESEIKLKDVDKRIEDNEKIISVIIDYDTAKKKMKGDNL